MCQAQKAPLVQETSRYHKRLAKERLVRYCIQNPQQVQMIVGLLANVCYPKWSPSFHSLNQESQRSSSLDCVDEDLHCRNQTQRWGKIFKNMCLDFVKSGFVCVIAMVASIYNIYIMHYNGSYILTSSITIMIVTMISIIIYLFLLYKWYHFNGETDDKLINCWILRPPTA